MIWNSVGILKMLSQMEETGTDCGGNPISGGAPVFFKGAAVTPVYEPMALQINKLRQKVEAGAKYSRPGVFDLDSLKRFWRLWTGRRSMSPLWRESFP